ASVRILFAVAHAHHDRRVLGPRHFHPLVGNAVSSDLGQLAASRHLISGAMAGAASEAAAPTPPAPAVLMKLRLVTWLISLPPGAVASASRRGPPRTCGASAYAKRSLGCTRIVAG